MIQNGAWVVGGCQPISIQQLGASDGDMATQ